MSKIPAPDDAPHGIDASPVDTHQALSRRRMLRVVLGAGTAAAGTSLLVACGGGSGGPSEQAASLASTVCTPTSWQLIAGQTEVVGTVSVTNDATNLYVTYAIDTTTHADCYFGTLHLWAGNDLLLVPSNPQGIPVPGQFPYQYNASGLQSHTFVVPLADLSITDVTTCGTVKLYVVTHAEVDCAGKSETAFGGDLEGSGPRWWFYGLYTLCCDPGVVVAKCQTAFAYGTHVFTTDPKSNPKKLPTLALSRNRWGWAIKLAAPGTTTWDIWAGAGLNDTARGTKVGTVKIVWAGTTVTVSYTLFTGFTIKEVHVYIGDPAPTTIAPGQYGITDYFDGNGVSSYMTTATVVDAGYDGIWVIAHAVVCRKA